mgnify:CR=1 FL=1
MLVYSWVVIGVVVGVAGHLFLRDRGYDWFGEILVGIAGVEPSSRTVSRSAWLEEPRSATVQIGVPGRKPSSPSACGSSAAWPGVSANASARPPASAKTCPFVLKPPRERPSA